MEYLQNYLNCLVTFQKYTQKCYFAKMSGYFAKIHAKIILCKNVWLLCNKSCKNDILQKCLATFQQMQKIYFAKRSGYMKKILAKP